MAITITIPRPARDDAADSDTSSDDDGTDIALRLASRSRLDPSAIVTPGERITDNPQWMKGHGTHIDPISGAIAASVAGTVIRTNRLLSVRPLHARYTPEIGDLVVGRVVEVQARRWRVDVGAAQLATLLLSAINLPGGVLRRRTDTDELQIRAFFAEGDALVCEVQAVHGDGGAALHARSLRYGKLRNGVFVAVAARGGTGGGVVRAKRHVWTMEAPAAHHAQSGDGPAGGASPVVDVVLGVNGYVWVCKHVEGGAGVSAGGGDGATAAGAEQQHQKEKRQQEKQQQQQQGMSRTEEDISIAAYSSQNETVDPGTVREIARIRSVIVALAENGMRVDEEAVRRGYAEAIEIAAETGPEDVFLGGRRGRRVARVAAAAEGY